MAVLYIVTLKQHGRKANKTLEPGPRERWRAREKEKSFGE